MTHFRGAVRSVTFLPRLTLRARLRAVIMLTTGTALVLAFALNLAFEQMNRRKRMVDDLASLAFVIALVLGCGLIAFVLSERLQETISRPVLDLVSAARTVTQNRNFVVRVEEGAHDEIGTLTRAFNEMLAEIENRDGALKEGEARLRHLAFHDPLTQLPNRALLLDHLKLGLAQARRHQTRLAVMFLDLDRFKIVNDSLGHSFGDRLLGMASGRLSAALREGDTVARIGGDEFMFLLPDLNTPADAAKVAEKILAALREPFLIDDQTLVVTGSLGIALFPSDGTDAETLVKNADISMYRAKDAGRDGYQLYSVELHARAQQRMHLESQMRAALLRRNFRVHYQPIVRAATGEVIGAEALLRWTHAERGVVPPSEFIPVAEETGLIVPLGEWVLNKACAKVASWDAAGLPPLRIAVNLSARQLSQPGFASKVAACLAANRLAPDRLELEITEGLLMDSAAPINESIEELRKLSVRLSIDDFGTGYSSLAYVKRFPVSTVKIDRSFVRNIETDPRNAAVARAIIALSHGLGMEVVAEGVESDEELGLLTREGCDSIQGYVFSRPVPSAEFAAFVAASVAGGAARGAPPPARSVSRERSKSIVTLFG